MKVMFMCSMALLNDVISTGTGFNLEASLTTASAISFSTIYCGDFVSTEMSLLLLLQRLTIVFFHYILCSEVTICGSVVY